MYLKIKNGKVNFPPEPNYSDEMKDLIVKLLDKDKAKRLGNLQSILRHPWFNGLDLDKVAAC